MTTSNSQQPQYIGDGIYIQVNESDPSQLILTTGSHILDDADNTVFIEIREARSLQNYLTTFLDGWK